MVLGDAVSKLETFVWILRPCFKVLNLVSVHPKSIILDQSRHDLSFGGVSLLIG